MTAIIKIRKETGKYNKSVPHLWELDHQAVHTRLKRELAYAYDLASTDKGNQFPGKSLAKVAAVLAVDTVRCDKALRGTEDARDKVVRAALNRIHRPDVVCQLGLEKTYDAFFGVVK